MADGLPGWRAWGLVLAVLGTACGWQEQSATPPPPDASEIGATMQPDGTNNDVADRYHRARHAMVEHQLRARDIRDERVLQAMSRVPREAFVPDDQRDAAYTDRPLPIGHKQTISQPYIVALMTQLARPTGESRVLDVGTGSGYQAAILAELAGEVYGIEIVEPLARAASERLEQLGYRNATIRHGDGYRGWPEHAPFDAIVVAAAPERIPPPLLEQLAPGGRLVIPVGEDSQELRLVEKLHDGTLREIVVAPVAFVPMTGEAQQE